MSFKNYFNFGNKTKVKGKRNSPAAGATQGYIRLLTERYGE